MKKINFTKAITELLIIFIGVSIALLGEQWRGDKEDERELKENLESISVSFASDSSMIVEFSYQEFEYIIGQLDSAIYFVTNYPKVDSAHHLVFENILIQPLMDFTGSKLTAFINSKSFGDLDNLELKENLLFYDFMIRDDWDKDKRILEYLTFEIRPLIHSILSNTGSSLKIDVEFINQNKIKIINDLNYLKLQYEEKKKSRLPYYLKWYSRIRIQIKDYNQSI
ncbi:MAG: hypothetical protein OEW67_09470 [Cyclobacteriaceae bacterium]|nr:hypothetical protein [Cyclobacteriaceae bacterium]